MIKTERHSLGFDLNDPDVLLCPHCDFTYLHQGRVDVFERQEDATDGLHVSTDGRQVQVDNDLADNPSRRRHGLRIYFSCEGCCAGPVLNIFQHKGQTFLRWEDRHGGCACAPDCLRYPVPEGAAHA